VDAHNSIYMLWDDVQFTLTKFRHGDITQRTDALVPNEPFTIAPYPDLAVSRDFLVHCVWVGIPSGSNERVYISSSRDSGMTLPERTRIDSVEATQQYPAIAVDSVGRVFVSYARSTSIRITRSTDGGLSFLPPTTLANGVSSSRPFPLCVDSPEGGINVLWSQSVTNHSRSSDGGVSFSSPIPVGAIAPHSLNAGSTGWLFASGEVGFYVHFTKANLLVNVSKPPLANADFQLRQNYPNPFNAHTRIPFALGEDSEITLKMFDTLGKEATELFSGNLAAGSYEVTWNANEYSSGVYFIQMTVGERVVKTVKLLLLR
jgi:hypothetical protein